MPRRASRGWRSADFFKRRGADQTGICGSYGYYNGVYGLGEPPDPLYPWSPLDADDDDEQIAAQLGDPNRGLDIGFKVAIRFKRPPSGSKTFGAYVEPSLDWGDTTRVYVYAISSPDKFVDWDDWTATEQISKGELLNYFDVEYPVGAYQYLHIGEYPAHGFLLECTDGAGMLMVVHTFLGTYPPFWSG